MINTGFWIETQTVYMNIHRIIGIHFNCILKVAKLNASSVLEYELYDLILKNGIKIMVCVMFWIGR